MRSCKSKVEYNDSQVQANTDKWNTAVFVLQNIKVQYY